MSSIEKRLRDELGELASWLIDRRAESSSVEQADSGSDSIHRLDLDADTVRPGGRGRLFRVAAALLLIVGIVSVSGLLSEDPPSVVTVPADPATQTPATSAPTTSVPPTTTVDDLSTDDPSDELSLVEPNLEVDPDPPPDVPLDESSTQAEEGLNDRFSPRRVFPWGDGFLRIGHLNMSEQDRTALNWIAQTSGDGLNWEEPFPLDLPGEHYGTLETAIVSGKIESWTIIRSSGERLVVLSQWPATYVIHGGPMDALGGRTPPASAYIEQRVFISVTDDLERWEHYEYPLPPSDSIDKSLSSSVVAQDLVLSDEGWVIPISTLAYMDVSLFLPDDIRGSAKEIRWHQYEEGTDRVPHEGLIIEWIVEEEDSTLHQPHSRFFSWAELGDTRDLFWDYGFRAIKPVQPSSRYFSSVLVARWGEEAIRTELPVHANCCKIVATDEGYVGIPADNHPANSPGYAPGQPGWYGMIFSPDGLTWQRIDSSADELFQNSPDCEVLWVPSIRAVEGGVVTYGSESWINPCGYSSDRFRSEFVWFGDDRGSNWISQNISDNPYHERYSVADSVGIGILVDTYLPLDYSEKSETSDTRYHSTIVSIDGVDWFTFYEESDPGWWSSVAFNGNVAVRVDNAGNYYRYELP